jgi:hypothetical protein
MASGTKYTLLEYELALAQQLKYEVMRMLQYDPNNRYNDSEKAYSTCK